MFFKKIENLPEEDTAILIGIEVKQKEKKMNESIKFSPEEKKVLKKLEFDLEGNLVESYSDINEPKKKRPPRYNYELK